MRFVLLRRVSWLGLLVQVVASLSVAAPVLCVADDGHVVLEAPHLGTCETDARRHHAERRCRLDEESAEHGCTDSVLSQPGRAEPRFSASDGTHAVSVPLPGAGLASSPHLQPAVSRPIPPDVLHTRRHVVLLI